MILDWDDDYDLDRDCKIWVLTGQEGGRLFTVVFDYQPSRKEMIEAEETVREKLNEQRE